MTAIERINEYSMEGSLALPLRQNLIDGWRPAALVEHAPVPEVQTEQIICPTTGERSPL